MTTTTLAVATLTEANSLDLLVGDDLSSAGYSKKEINLIGYCWQDASQINTKKTALALHLFELKKELDNGDPLAGTNPNGKSRFWAAFEAGHLPLQGDAGRNSVKTALQAAEWLAKKELADPSANSLHALAPSTIVEISNLGVAAQCLVFKALESSDFIGVAAVRLLARESKEEVIYRLFSWVDDNPGTAITPRVIGALSTQVAKESEPASSKTVDITPAQQQRSDDTMANIHNTRAERTAKVEVDHVREQLDAAEQQQRHMLQEEVRGYSSNLIAASKAIHGLLGYLQSLSHIHGTQLLDEMRRTDFMGLVTVSDDMQRLQEMGQELMQAVNLARSSDPPTGINAQTIEV